LDEEMLALLFLDFMCFFYLQTLFITNLTTAATLNAPGPVAQSGEPSILENDTAESARNDTVASPKQSPNGLIILPQDLDNGSYPALLKRPNGTIASPSSMIKFKVPKSPTTLAFYAFKSSLPVWEIMLTVDAAIKIPFAAVKKLMGEKPIVKGYFRYTSTFTEGGKIVLTVGDFRELGRPITYYVLCDIMRGIGEFVMSPEHNWTEMTFEVEVEEIGHVGSGHIGWEPAGPTTTPTLT